MNSPNIKELAKRIREKRASKGIRETAREIGISPATLSRVENEKVPDLDTFGRICAWTGDDPSTFFDAYHRNEHAPRVKVHFKKESAINSEAARALGEMIMLAQQKLLDEETIEG